MKSKPGEKPARRILSFNQCPRQKSKNSIPVCSPARDLAGMLSSGIPRINRFRSYLLTVEIIDSRCHEAISGQELTLVKPIKNPAKRGT